MESSQDHIFIVGNGAIGRALAVLLKQAGRQVTILRGSLDDGTRIREDLLLELTDGTIRRAVVDVATFSRVLPIEGIVVLTNKSYGNDRLAAVLKGTIGRSPIVLLQNGLGVEQPFIDNNFRAIYRAVLFVTSQLANGPVIRYRPVSASPIGIERGSQEELDHIVNRLSTSEFQFIAESDIQRVIWMKTIINCVFNSICPLIEVDNGIFHRNESYLAIAKRVINECVGVANELNVNLEEGDIVARLLSISRASDGQEISTLQDLRHGRMTEIDTLNLAVARVADRFQLKTNVEVTRLLGQLIKLKENTRLGILLHN